jgi:hypothetical protein
MKSRVSSARESRAPFGVESTGFPAIVTAARTWPGPGVSISSLRIATGHSPPNSGRPRTRLRRVANRPRCPMRVANATRSAAGRVNIDPPARSRLPVTTFTTFASQQASPPNSWVEIPTRP